VLVETSQPTHEPITIAEAKAHLRVDGSDEDGYIAGCILAARHHAEAVTRRALVPREWKQTYNYFPAEIVLPVTPVQTVDAIKYIDRDGVEQTLASYQQSGERIVPAFEQHWPETRRVVDAVSVEFTAGYDDVPADIRAALLLLVAHYFEQRQPTINATVVSVVPMSVDALLSPYFVRGF
jgi:uncharacterized phiE125 gp8 family phage protein